MPRFYFHLVNRAGETRDEEGLELSDLEAARREALAGIRSILKDGIGKGRLDLGESIRIADGMGRSLLDVPFETAVEVWNRGAGR